MKKHIFILFAFVFFLSCQDKDAIRREEARKDEIKREELFQQINKNWDFKTADFTEETYAIVQQWPEWNNFYHELLQKPQTDIGAFRRKANTLVNQSEALQSTIPDFFNVTQIQSRFLVLDTKLKMLKTYINLDDIPTEDVIRTVKEINIEIESIVNRMKTILVKSRIEREEGEEQMLRSLSIDSLRRDLELLELDAKTQSD